jgi:hypothetical protein
MPYPGAVIYFMLYQGYLFDYAEHSSPYQVKSMFDRYASLGAEFIIPPLGRWGGGRGRSE